MKRCTTIFSAAALLMLGCIAHAAEWNTVNPEVKIAEGLSFPAVAYNPASGRLELIAFSNTHIHHGTADLRLNAETLAEAVELPEVRTGEYNSPHLIVDKKGVAHLVFAHGWAGRSTEVWYTNNAGGSWKKPIRCMSAKESPDQMNRANYPRLAVIGDTAYVVAFVYKEYTGVIAKIVGITGDGMAVEKLVTIRQDNPYVLALDPDRLFVAGRYTYDYYSTEPEKISGGTHGGKSHEMMGAAAGPDGIVHLIGMSGHKVTTMYYTNTGRAEQGLPVINGETVHSDSDAELHIWPEIEVDARNLVYVAYRDYNDQQGKVLTIRDGVFSEPVVFVRELMRRMRYNLSMSAGPDGGVYLAWHNGDSCYAALVGAPLDAAAPSL